MSQAVVLTPAPMQKQNAKPALCSGVSSKPLRNSKKAHYVPGFNTFFMNSRLNFSACRPKPPWRARG